ncbi:hypothetical protein [Labrenzia sp. OB1]|uniref:hypothetical protein n=1 Tax=Labrenzia sp. OB1 TaxID=1561204 RepID=UPI0007B2A54D|nr:hypothetical protein [Labrenzia sp. OB1]KZM44486.1 hypothetical protein OA90_27025 [Labrenzia sp. OB1]
MQRKTYQVADGVSVINGAQVPANRTVKLTPAEARYDLSIGRLTHAKPVSRKKSSEPENGEG